MYIALFVRAYRTWSPAVFKYLGAARMKTRASYASAPKRWKGTASDSTALSRWWKRKLDLCLEKSRQDKQHMTGCFNTPLLALLRVCAQTCVFRCHVRFGERLVDFSFNKDNFAWNSQATLDCRLWAFAKPAKLNNERPRSKHFQPEKTPCWSSAHVLITSPNTARLLDFTICSTAHNFFFFNVLSHIFSFFFASIYFHLWRCQFPKKCTFKSCCGEQFFGWLNQGALEFICQLVSGPVI